MTGEGAGGGELDGLIDEFEHQSAAFFLAARDRPWADVHVEPDVIWGTTGIPLANFNGATNARFIDASVDDRIEAILGEFRATGVDMTWWIGPTSRPASLVDRLIAHGLVVDTVAPGMACSLEGWSAPPLADGVTTELVTDDAGFHVATEVMFAGFEMPTELLPMVEDRYRSFCVGREAIQRFFLARLDGVPVATSLGFTLDGVVGIYNVATLPDARRRGAGSAATAAAMADAQARGARAALLESSPMGRGVYERLGFRAVTELTILAGMFSGSGGGVPAATS